jgi:UDP-glucose 4-epimerase
MKILVIGGGGFIGRHLVSRLLSLDQSVAVLDDFSFSERPDNPSYDLFIGDATNDSLVDAVVNKFHPDIIVWLIAFHAYAPGQDPIVRHSWLTHSISRVLPLIARVVPKFFVIGSSDTVYKVSPKLIKETSPLNWGSPQTPVMNKMMLEWYTSAICQSLKMPFLILRFSNIIGNRIFTHPAADPLTFLIDALLLEEPIALTKPQQKKDYLYIDNAVEMMSNILLQEKNSGVYNISSAHGITNLEILQEIKVVLDLQQLPKVVESKEGDIVLDNSKALKLGNVKIFSLQEKLEEIINFRRQVLEG